MNSSARTELLCSISTMSMAWIIHEPGGPTASLESGVSPTVAKSAIITRRSELANLNSSACGEPCDASPVKFPNVRQVHTFEHKVDRISSKLSNPHFRICH